MNPIARERLFGFEHAFDHAVTRIVVAGLVLVLVVVPLLFAWLRRRGRIDSTLHAELRKRYLSWLVLVPLMLVPVLLGAAWTILGIGLLSLLCYREYARATGLFREKAISFTIVVGIVLVTFTVFDHWYGSFAALTPLAVATIAAVAILADRPKGYIQRVALGVLGFLLFGTALGHLGYFANDEHYRPLLLLILLSVEMNDVFAFVVGKSLGRHKLAPNTSPNKTVEGSLGALVLTTLLVIGLGQWIYSPEYRLAHGVTDDKVLRYLVLLGLIVGVVGQLGDLMLSSIKRDLGVKDFGTVIPGHGGLLDRFDSLILVAPAAFHFVNYVAGVGLNQPTRVLTGAG